MVVFHSPNWGRITESHFCMVNYASALWLWHRKQKQLVQQMAHMNLPGENKRSVGWLYLSDISKSKAPKDRPYQTTYCLCASQSTQLSMCPLEGMRNSEIGAVWHVMVRDMLRQWCAAVRQLWEYKEHAGICQHMLLRWVWPQFRWDLQ